MVRDVDLSIHNAKITIYTILDEKFTLSDNHALKWTDISPITAILSDKVKL